MTAALELVAAHGLEAVSVEQITAQAGVGLRTFFHHFPTKEAALLEPGDRKASVMAEALLARPAAESAFEAVRAVAVQGAASLAEHGDLVRLRFEVLRANPELWAAWLSGFWRLEDALAQAIAVRTGLDPDADTYPRLLAAVAVAAVRTSIARWRATGWSGSPAVDVADAFDRVSAGLAAPTPAARTPEVVG